MMSTGTASTVTFMATGIALLTTGTVGIAAAVRIGGGRKAVGTGQIMTEEGYRLITEVTSETGNLRHYLPAGGEVSSLFHSMCLHQCFLPLPLDFPLAWEVASSQVSGKEFLFRHFQVHCLCLMFVSWQTSRSCPRI